MRSFLGTVLEVCLLLCHRTSVMNGSTLRFGLLADGVPVCMPVCCPSHFDSVGSCLWSARGLGRECGMPQLAQCTLAQRSTRLCLVLRGGKGADRAGARTIEKVAKKPHYKVRAAARAQKVADSAAPPTSRAKKMTVKGKQESLNGLKSPIASQEHTQTVHVGEEESEAAHQGGQGKNDVDGKDADSSGKGVGWEAVSAGVTNARDLLGLAKKREWTNHRGTVVAKKPWCASAAVLLLLLLLLCYDCCCYCWHLRRSSAQG